MGARMAWRARPRVVLGLVGAVMLAARFVLIAATADVQTDAYGHFRIARALLRDPLDPQVHWVWLPGWHYALWALLHLGVGFTGLRVIAALMQAGAPFLLYDFCLRRDRHDDRDDQDPEGAARVALVASLVFTIAPLSNRLALSAQAETCFACVVLASAWSVERRRFALAGMLLIGACMLRYEAWGAIPALVLQRVRRGREGPGLASFLPPAIAVAAWIVLRHAVDGEWLAFVRHTQSFASGVRHETTSSPIVDAVLVPLALPLVAFGPAALLIPFGLRRSLRPGWVIPGGILAFLVVSHVGRGALGLDRYLTALVPFACIAMADGALVVSARLRRAPGSAARALFAVTALTLVAHLGWLVHRATARAAELYRYEAEVEQS
jgi:hypothetical protein